MEIKMFIFGYYLLQIRERDKLGANVRGRGSNRYGWGHSQICLVLTKLFEINLCFFCLFVVTAELQSYIIKYLINFYTTNFCCKNVKR